VKNNQGHITVKGDFKIMEEKSTVQPIAINAVETYQCSGCVGEADMSCYEASDDFACKKHCAGTIITGTGRIFLGMPIGFNRLGAQEETTIYIFESLADGWEYDMYNIPVWKHLNDNGHTLVRGLCPRTNYAWIHIFLEDCIDKIECREISNADIMKMD